MKLRLTSDDARFFKDLHISADPTVDPCDHDHCTGCDCARHYVDADTEAAFDAHLVGVQKALLQDAAEKIAELTDERDALTDECNTWRRWCLMACGAIVANVIIQLSVLWGR